MLGFVVNKINIYNNVKKIENLQKSNGINNCLGGIIKVQNSNYDEYSGKYKMNIGTLELKHMFVDFSNIINFEVKLSHKGNNYEKQLSNDLTNSLEMSSECYLIKGNINSKGEKIYHVPGGVFYDKINTKKYFDTEKDAQAEGYRKSKR